MILVTGGAGFLGARLVKGLAASGRRVRVIALPRDPNLKRLGGVDCDVVEADVTDAASLEGAFDGVRTVYHLTGIIITNDPAQYRRVNVEGTGNVVQAARSAGVEHFIYVSSAAVVFPESSAYAQSKLAAENLVTGQSDMRYTIIRPTLMYGRDGGQEFMMFVDYLKKFPVVPFVGRGRGRKKPILFDDVVQGLLAVADNPRSYGQIYNFCGDETVSIRELARLILERLGRPKPILTIPIPLCRAAAWVMERTMKNPPLTTYAVSRIQVDADLDNTSARRDLGLNPLGLQEGLDRCFGPPRGARRHP
ncbi:MAG: NAD-dependent epimerase/dehydratase family protein [Pseudomonadota bacterium]